MLFRGDMAITYDEAAVGLFDEEEVPLLSEQDTAPMPSVPAKRKTKAERRKARDLKEAEHTRVRERRQKQMLAQIDHARTITKQVRREMLEREQRRAARTAKRVAKVRRMPLEVQLEEELADSLRTVKPEGNLLADRFRSLQERVVIEPNTSLRKWRRSRLLKEYQKHSHK